MSQFIVPTHASTNLLKNFQIIQAFKIAIITNKSSPTKFQLVWLFVLNLLKQVGKQLIRRYINTRPIRKKPALVNVSSQRPNISIFEAR